MGLPNKTVCVSCAIMYDFPVKLPWASKNKMAYIHRCDVKIGAIPIMRTNGEGNKHSLSNTHATRFSDPAKGVGNWMVFSDQTQLIHSVVGNDIA